MSKSITGGARCSILEDGHRATATHRVASLVYGQTAGMAVERAFCPKCAAAEVKLLRDFGFECTVRFRVPTRRISK